MSALTDPLGQQSWDAESAVRSLSLFLEGADDEAAEEEDAEGGEGAAGGDQPQHRLQGVVLGDENQRPCARGRRTIESVTFAGLPVSIMGRGGSGADTSAWPRNTCQHVARSVQGSTGPRPHVHDQV